MRTLPAKRDRVVYSSSVSPLACASSAAALVGQTRKKLKHQDPWTCRDDILVKEEHWVDEQIEAKLAFCCYTCKCSEPYKSQFPPDDAYVQSSANALWYVPVRLSMSVSLHMCSPHLTAYCVFVMFFCCCCWSHAGIGGKFPVL
jgi:hypothetical protein